MIIHFLPTMEIELYRYTLNPNPILCDSIRKADLIIRLYPTILVGFPILSRLLLYVLPFYSSRIFLLTIFVRRLPYNNKQSKTEKTLQLFWFILRFIIQNRFKMKDRYRLHILLGNYINISIWIKQPPTLHPVDPKVYYW